MFKNYFRTSFRSLRQNKGTTAINVIGLAAGIAVCLLIFLVIAFETSFDEFHMKKDRIYRVLTEYHHNDSKDIFYGRGVPKAFYRGIKDNFADLESIAPVYADYNDQVLVSGSQSVTPKKFKEERGIFFTTPSFFKIFDYPVLAGSFESLNDPNNVLLTQETAEKYFGSWQQAVGKTLRLNNTLDLKVSGILANMPANTGFPIKLAISFGTGYTAKILNSTNWDGTSTSFGCYILLAKNSSAAGFNKQLMAYSRKMKSPDNKDLQVIQPLKEVHFDTRAGDYGGKTISRQLIRIMWLIASFILLIACVNFINLSTAQAVNRAKEIGVRKVLGSNRWQLQFQFLTETFLIVLASIILSVVFAMLTLPSINNLLELAVKITPENVISITAFLLALATVVTLLAGFYPSIVLSGFNPVEALKSKLAAKTTRGISLRRGLVVFQFIIAQSLIIATIVIARQMSFFASQPLGFDKTAVVNIPVPEDSAGNSKLGFLKKQLKTLNGINNVSFNSNTPVEDNNDNWTNINFDHAQKQTDFYSIFKTADDEYVPGFKLPLVAGRNLEPSDTIREFLVNEMLLRNLGITDPQKALNKHVYIYDHAEGPIVGVLKDFNTRSFRDDLAPLIITTSRREYNEASIKLDSRDMSGTMQQIEKVWNETFPEFVFEYKFLDEKVESFYKQENRLEKLYKIFAAITIILSCLGLYGLASFMAAQRIREVGIRKVLGASGANIVYLFSREFILLIGVAFGITIPLTWYFMNQWLQNYPFRIELSWWLFGAGGIISILIAISTVSFHAIRAALANPVRSLRSE